ERTRARQRLQAKAILGERAAEISAGRISGMRRYCHMRRQPCPCQGAKRPNRLHPMTSDRNHANSQLLAVIPAAFVIRETFSISILRKAPNCSGVLPTTVAP